MVPNGKTSAKRICKLCEDVLKGANVNKKKYIKKIFTYQLNNGFQFEYLNEDNTIMKYCLKKSPICIYLIEDYRHEFLSMEVVWNDSIIIINIDGIICSSKIQCVNQLDLEKKLKEIYSPLHSRIRGSLKDKQFCELVSIYQAFLDSNSFFENVIFKDTRFLESIDKCDGKS